MELLPSVLSTLKSQDPAALNQEYSVVRSQTLSMKKDLGLTTEAGALKENIKKNRYKDILPYDQSRVVLSPLTSDSDSDYINASFIKGVAADNKYIACQGPLSSTVIDFWRMIWQHDVKVIVMACREIEMGKKKCECYWAPVDQSASFGPFTIDCQGESNLNEDIVVRTLTVTYQQDSRSLVHYQFLSWPDHDVPYEAAGVVDLLEKVRDSQKTHTAPLLIHCSAGCGRTGVICAIDYIHDLLVTEKLTDFSIKEVVLQLRSQRPSAVQTKEQYQFIFTAVACMFQRALQPTRQRRYSILPQKPNNKTTTASVSRSKRTSKVIDMNDTYAVVNKSKQPHPPATSPTHSIVAPPRTSRTLPPSHHYDNESEGASAAPVYSSVVKPRAKPQSMLGSSTAIYDIATSANQKPGEGPSSAHNGEYQLVQAKGPSQIDDDYEEFSTSVTDMSNFCSPGGIGFNCRVQKPRGPRDPPAEWSRLER